MLQFHGLLLYLINRTDVYFTWRFFWNGIDCMEIVDVGCLRAEIILLEVFLFIEKHTYSHKVGWFLILGYNSIRDSKGYYLLQIYLLMFYKNKIQWISYFLQTWENKLFPKIVFIFIFIFCNHDDVGSVWNPKKC